MFLRKKLYWENSGYISPAGIYSFKVNNGNTRTICQICSKLTMKRQDAVIFNFEHISHIVLVFQALLWWEASSRSTGTLERGKMPLTLEISSEDM